MTCECHTEIQKNKQTNKDKNKIVTVPEWWLEVAIMSNFFFFNHVSQAKNLDQKENFLKENKQSQNIVA